MKLGNLIMISMTINDESAHKDILDCIKNDQ